MGEVALAHGVPFIGPGLAGPAMLEDPAGGGLRVQIVDGVALVCNRQGPEARAVEARAVLPEADTPAAEAPRATADPPLAMGLNGISDWSTEQPFVDIMKTARPWTGHLPGQWDGWNPEQLRARGYLDAEGWPTAVPRELTGISTLFLTDQPEGSVSLAGRYRLTYQGAGTIALDGRVSNVVRRKGEIWFDYSPGEGSVVLTITASDPTHNGQYIRDIRIVKAEDIDLFEAGVVFNPRWLARIAGLRALRFMDWMATNNSTIADWSERPRPDDYTFGWRGVPAEVMVALANQTAADPWFNLPHRATDSYIRGLAELVHETLDPRRKAYVEYSNETWNWGFEQAHWLQDQARARWGDAAGGDAWMQFAGKQVARMAQIWDAAFGAEANQRLVKVIATQTGWLGLEQPLLDAPLWVAEDPAHNRPPARYVDAYAVTGYFGAQLGYDKAASVKQWIAASTRAAEADAAAHGLTGAARSRAVAAHRFDGAIAKAAAELHDGSVTGNPADTLASLVGETLTYQAGVAREHALALVMYEGGTHAMGGGDWVNDQDLTDFFLALNYSPEMAGLYRQLLAGWQQVGGTLFNAFVDVGAPSKWGSWGALRSLDDANPRWDALQAFNRDRRAWWEVRPAGSFDRGATLFGTAAGETLRGGPEGDILLGRGGDDTLIGGGGDDRLHGGGGRDTVILPGRRDQYRFATDGDALVAQGPAGALRLVAIETIGFAASPGQTVATARLP